MYNPQSLLLVKTSDSSIKRAVRASQTQQELSMPQRRDWKASQTPESIPKAHKIRQGFSETPDERGKAESAKCLIGEKETLRDRTDDEVVVRYTVQLRTEECLRALNDQISRSTAP